MRSVTQSEGGYDPSVAPEAYTDDSRSLIHFIVRGEGETRPVETVSGHEQVLGLSVSVKLYEPPKAGSLRPT